MKRVAKRCGLVVAVLVAAASAFTAAQADASAPPLPEGLSASDWSGIVAARSAARRAIVADERGGHRAWNPNQAWTARFDARGFEVSPRGSGWTWGLELARWGRTGAERGVTIRASAAVDGARMSYGRNDGFVEWFVNAARGLEHGFTIESRPDGEGPISIELAVRGGLCAETQDDMRGARFVDEAGAAALIYGGLAASDADGRPLPARMESWGDGLRLIVDDDGARYPVTIDPLAQQAFLAASNSDQDDYFGRSVAISGDTVVVGAHGEDSAATGVNGDQWNNAAGSSGAAYVFVRSGTTWSQQAYLKASNTGALDAFGFSVAVSGDTVVVGAYGEDSAATGVNGVQASNAASSSGAAYVFVRSGTTWSQQAYLKASNTEAGDSFGDSVAISGNTVVVGSPFEDSAATGVNGNQASNAAIDSGAAYVFVRNGTTWSQQAYLKASNTNALDRFGDVAIAGDSIVVGASLEDSAATGVNGNQASNAAIDSGAAYVFVRSGTTWSQQAYLKPSNTNANDHFATSVAASGDTIVVGAPDEDSAATGVNGNQASNSASGSGAAYVFVRSGTTWNQQAYLKASNTDAGDGFGNSVAISGEGLVVGALYEDSAASGVSGDQTNNAAPQAGAAYSFVRFATTWSQAAYLKASSTAALDELGVSVAISDDTIVAGAPLKTLGPYEAEGAAFVFSTPLGGDLNGDWHVNAVDLATLLGQWGVCAPTQACKADLNDDGIVNAADLAILLGAWTG
ncbi:MAG: dockerin type I domain-containing protein [Phycisphaerales bacterium]